MDRLEEIISILDHALNTKKKRHIAGGVLISISLFFGGLAVTIITLKGETEEDDYDWDEMYYNSCSSHHSILEGGYDEPTMDEWERSGLL